MSVRPRTIVTLSMLWAATMALVSTPEWVVAARETVVNRSTKKTDDSPSASTQPGSTGTPTPSIAADTNWERFAVGIGALWVILLALTEAGADELAEALALVIAGSSTALYLPKAIENLGLNAEGGK